MPWQPAFIRRPDQSLATAADTVRVTTDAGPGYLKALGNRGGPHRLAADWVGTQLAAWLGLPTFEFAIIHVLPSNEIPFFKGGQAQPGPAFITRLEPGMTWGGDAATLTKLVNPQDIGMNATKGYFSLVQYSPDVARQEAANVGVVLFCPEPHFIRAKVSDSIARIRRFFGNDVAGYQQLNAMKAALVSRIDIENAEFTNLEALQQFVATRGNNILLTQPKPVTVLDPESDLVALYEELVADPKKPLTVRTNIRLRKRLNDVLMDAALKPYIRTKLRIEAPALKETLSIPYAFQNGRFNLIRSTEFKHQNEAGVRVAACKQAIEGLTLFKHKHPNYGDMQLLVVADFAQAPQGSTDLVRGIFTESNVRLFTPDALDTLKHEILTQGKPATPSQSL